MSAFRPKGHIMKTRVFEPGAICAAIALLLVLSLPAYAKKWRVIWCADTRQQNPFEH